MQIVAVAGAAGFVWHKGIDLNAMGLQAVRRSQSMMGTAINFTLYSRDRDEAAAAIDEAVAKMRALEAVLSRHSPESEVSRLNSRGRLRGASPSLSELISMADRVRGLTAGAFDITVLPLVRLFERATSAGRLPTDDEIGATLPLVDGGALKSEGGAVDFARPGMGLTFDGIGKGYIVDQGVDTLAAAGFENVYLEAGGDLMVRGFKGGKHPWRIGIRNPRPQHRQRLMVVEVSDRAVATSGDYLQFYSADKRCHHIVNPLTGISPAELASATVIAPTVALADALATGSMVMGSERSLALLDSLDGCEGLFIDKNLRVRKTGGFRV